MNVLKPDAKNIYDLIRQRFSSDKYLCVPECKIGSTWFSHNCLRFDAWIMSRSWKYLRFIGCEIKTSRQDFLNDNKWQNYLPYCSEFYFVTANRIAEKEEIPEQAGFLEATRNHKKLILKKKAPIRNMEIPESLFVYILMCRTKITSEIWTKRDYWEDVLKRMKANKRLGYEIKLQINDLVEKRVSEVIENNKKLRDENYNLQRMKEHMEYFGLSDEDLRFGQSKLKNKLEEIKMGYSKNLFNHFNQLEATMNSIKKILEG